MKYIIRKRFSCTDIPYAGPMCGLYNVEKGLFYDTVEAAQTDCDKLNYSSVYFEVGEVEV